jgi:hypothetical protein
MHDTFRVGELFESFNTMVAAITTHPHATEGHIRIHHLIHRLI